MVVSIESLVEGMVVLIKVLWLSSTRTTIINSFKENVHHYFAVPASSYMLP